MTEGARLGLATVAAVVSFAAIAFGDFGMLDAVFALAIFLAGSTVGAVLSIPTETSEIEADALLENMNDEEMAALEAALRVSRTEGARHLTHRGKPLNEAAAIVAAAHRRGMI